MKIIIRILPVEYFALLQYTRQTTRHVQQLSPEHRHIGDVLMSELFEVLDRNSWKWQHFKNDSKPYMLRLDYSDAKTLGLALMQMCPVMELQEVLSKLHKALVDFDGTLLDNLKLEQPP